MVLGMPLTSFMSKILGMMNPMLSSLSRAMQSRHAKSPAHHSSFLRYDYVPRRVAWEDGSAITNVHQDD